MSSHDAHKTTEHTEYVKLMRMSTVNCFVNIDEMKIGLIKLLHLAFIHLNDANERRYP